MTHQRAATLEERACFLLALFARPKMFHGSYIVEKLDLALAEGTRPATLEALLDEENKKRYALFLDPRQLWRQSDPDHERSALGELLEGASDE